MTMITLKTWERREIYAFYRTFADPWFNLTVEVDVAATRRWCRERGERFSWAVWFAVQQAANSQESFRMRLREEGVWLHERVRIGATVIKPDKAFTYVYFPDHSSFPAFAAAAAAEVARRMEEEHLVPSTGDDALLYCTAVPWVRFTGIKHARAGDPNDSVPRIAVGRATEMDGRVQMPVSVEAHHALVDGIHVAEFLAELERLLANPSVTFG